MSARSTSRSRARSSEIVEVERGAEVLALGVGLAEAFEELADRLIGGDRLGNVRESRIGLTLAAQLGVDAEDDRAQGVGSVGGEEIDGKGGLSVEEAGEGVAEGERAQAVGQALLENLKAGLNARLQGVDAQEACAEAVERAHAGRLRLARQIPLAERQKAGPHALAQLAGGALGEGDGEDPPGREAVLADGPHEALDEH